jgi:hypothetical protein
MKRATQIRSFGISITGTYLVIQYSKNGDAYEQIILQIGTPIIEYYLLSVKPF